MVREEELRAAKIGAAIEDLKNQQMDLHCSVALKSIPAYQALTLREIIPDYFAEASLWMKLGEKMERENIRLPQNTLNLAIYHDTDFKDSDVDVEVCAVLPEPDLYRKSSLYHQIEEVKNMACFLVYGPFQNIASGFASFAQWLTEHEQYTMSGLNRQIIHRGPWNEEDPNKYLTEIQIPVQIST